MTDLGKAGEAQYPGPLLLALDGDLLLRVVGALGLVVVDTSSIEGNHGSDGNVSGGGSHQSHGDVKVVLRGEYVRYVAGDPRHSRVVDKVVTKLLFELSGINLRELFSRIQSPVQATEEILVIEGSHNTDLMMKSMCTAGNPPTQ